jgi:hypothetical protein
MNALYQKGKESSRGIFTFWIVYLSGKKKDDLGMTREELRRKNAKALADLIGGLAEFGRKVEMSDSQVSQIIGRTPKKNIGNKIAPRIEDAFELPRGWLDAVNSREAIAELFKKSGSTQEQQAPAPEQQAASLELVNSGDIAQLVALYGESTRAGRAYIMQAAHDAEKSAKQFTLALVPAPEPLPQETTPEPNLDPRVGGPMEKLKQHSSHASGTVSTKNKKQPAKKKPHQH